MNRLALYGSLTTLGVFGVATLEAKNIEAKALEKPNFIIIFTDDQGYQDLGCFGSPLIKTPNIDKMASEGMMLTSFYAQQVSGPSRASLMTGCYPLRTARVNNDFDSSPHPNMSLSEVTIAEVLKQQNYSTCMVGKWDLAGRTKSFETRLSPSNQGFDQSIWAPRGNSPGFVDLYLDEKLYEANPDMSQLTRRYTDYALEYIEKAKDEPFFLYIAHTMPHVTLMASEDFLGKSARGLYGDCIEEIDYNVGRIMAKLKELGIDDNTYVIFTSDNGPWWIEGENGGCAAPLRSGKTSVWEGGVRVPCVVRAPGRVPAGTSSDLVTSTIDMLPTIAKLAGCELPNDRVIDGCDISKVIHGKQSKLDRTFFYYQHMDLRAVRKGKWKLYLPHEEYHKGIIKIKAISAFAYDSRHIAPEDRVFFSELMLFDLDQDISESTNVAKENPKVVKQLLKELEWASTDIGNYTDGRGVNARCE